MMDSAPNQINIMTLNLRFGLADDGPNNWKHRCQAYPDLFDAYPCDLYTFQEANDFQITFIQNLLEKYDHIGQRRPAPKGWQSNVIFFHPSWKCVSYEHFFLSATPEVPSKFPRSLWPRQCTVALLERENSRLLCANTHFDFDTDVQRHSALLIKKRLSRYGLDWPALIAGDFNAPPSSSCYEVFTDADTHQESFRNAFGLSPGKGTYHGFEETPGEEAIDWILYRGKLAVHSTEVVTRKFNGYHPSDHYPLTATFNWLEA